MSTKRKAAWIAPSFDDFPKTQSKEVKKKEKTIDQQPEDHVPWVRKYKPLVEEDLAVHKKKIQEVKSWLEKNSDNQSGNILLLTGPAGSGKSAVVHTLSDDLGLDLKEWINPLMQEYSKDIFHDISARQESQSQLFHDFILRANRYNQLEVMSNLTNTTLGSHNVILVEDLPNFLLYDTSKIHTILRQYTQNGKCPLVFIMSDSNSDNFINSMFPKKLLNELKITNISFNPVSQTGMTKTMLKIATLESNQVTYVFHIDIYMCLNVLCRLHTLYL